MYQEKIYLPKPIMLLLIIADILVVVSLIFSFFKGELSWVLSLFVLVIILVSLFFIQLKIKITNEYLVFGFFIFIKKFKLVDLENVEIKDLKFSNYLGYGIRFGRDKSLGYVAGSKKGVLLKFKDNKKSYFVSSNNPEQILSLLKSKVTFPQL